MNSPQENTDSPQEGGKPLLDRIGVVASSLCAVHCLCLPLLLVAIPAIADSFIANRTVERVFISASIVLATACACSACRAHGRWWPMAMIGGGATFLIVAQTFAPPACCAEGWTWHVFAAAAGGGLLAASHVINLRLTRLHAAVAPDCCGDSACSASPS